MDILKLLLYFVPMTETQRQLIYDLAKRLDMVIEVNGVCYRFFNGVLCKIK